MHGHLNKELKHADGQQNLDYFRLILNIMSFPQKSDIFYYYYPKNLHTKKKKKNKLTVLKRE